MEIFAGLILGSGMGSAIAKLGGRLVHVPTEFGLARGRLIDIDGRSVLALARHGVGHKLPPHKVPYRANALALAQLGAKYCLATAAVGSLRKQLQPKTLIVCSGVIDASSRNLTLFENKVQHTSVNTPMSESCRVAMIHASRVKHVEIREHGVYVGVNGPRFETPDEIQMFASMGGDIVGMTAHSEAIACREAGVDYGCIAMVTNFGAGLNPTPPNDEEVQEVMEEEGPVILEILLRAIRELQ